MKKLRQSLINKNRADLPCKNDKGARQAEKIPLDRNSDPNGEIKSLVKISMGKYKTI